MKSKLGLYIAEKVKEKRAEADFSRRALADCLNLNESYLRQAENPKLPLVYNITLLNAIAYILNCSVRDFIPDKPIVEDSKYLPNIER